MGEAGAREPFPHVDTLIRGLARESFHVVGSGWNCLPAPVLRANTTASLLYKFVIRKILKSLKIAQLPFGEVPAAL